jgi:iron complex transport system substrate-binding protein
VPGAARCRCAGEPGANPGLARSREVAPLGGAAESECPQRGGPHAFESKVSVMPRPFDALGAPAPPSRSARAALLAAALALVPASCDRAEPTPRQATELARAEPLERPVRIVPSTARALEFTAALVGPERVAGLPEQGFEYATLGADEARFAVLPRFYAYRAEDILALKPDLVLGDPWQPGDTDARLLEAGVRIVRLPATVTWREAADVLVQLGALLGEPERAGALVADLERRVAVLASTSERRAGLRVLPYSNFGSEGFSAGAGTTVDEVLRLAGVVNACSGPGRDGHVKLDFEELLVLDPDVIVVSAPLRAELGHAGDKGGASRGVLEGEARLASLRAVRERRIVELPPGLYACASHLVVQAAEELARQIDALGTAGGGSSQGGEH